MINLATCSNYALLSATEVAEAANVRKAAQNSRLRAVGGFRVLYFSARSVREFVDGRDQARRGRSRLTNNGVEDEGDRLAPSETRMDLR
jgi:hypothetical protein